MPVRLTSRRRNDEGEVLLVKLRDRKLLIALRQGRPDAKGRPGRCLSQRQVADAVEISHGHYADVERGTRQVSYAVGKRLAAFFGVSMDALFEEIPLEYGAPDGPAEGAA